MGVVCVRKRVLTLRQAIRCGEPTLRRAIVDYLRLSRSIECRPEQVFDHR